MRRWRWTALTVVAAMALAACGGDADEPSPTTPSVESTGDTPGPLDTDNGTGIEDDNSSDDELEEFDPEGPSGPATPCDLMDDESLGAAFANEFVVSERIDGGAQCEIDLDDLQGDRQISINAALDLSADLWDTRLERDLVIQPADDIQIGVEPGITTFYARSDDMYLTLRVYLTNFTDEDTYFVDASEPLSGMFVPMSNLARFVVQRALR